MICIAKEWLIRRLERMKREQTKHLVHTHQDRIDLLNELIEFLNNEWNLNSRVKRGFKFR